MCENLRSARLSNSLTTLQGGFFNGCLKLTDVTIPNSVTVVGNGAFKDCRSLPSLVIPAGVTDIGWEAFRGCTSLTSISLPETVKAIPADAFLFCSQLKDITIPAGVTSIGSRAFESCESLASIVIPAGVTSMGNEVFKGCTSLTVVRMQGSPPTIGTAVFGGVNPSRAGVYYPAGTDGWTDTFGGLPAWPYGVSGMPTAVVGIRSNGQVLLSWTAPVSNGGSGVTDYTIQYSSDSGSSWQTFTDAVSAATSVTVTGLTNGTGYLFRVAAVNDVGTGSYSANSSTVTPATTPGTPTTVVGVRGNGQVQLSWTAPVSNGGLLVTDYTIQYSSNSGASWQTFTDAVSAATSATVTGLTNGTGYLFRVASVNDVGTGLYSANSLAVTPATTPSTPTAVAGIRGNGQIQLSWTAPSSNGGLSVTDYTIHYSSNSGSSWQTFTDAASSATSATVTGLTNGTGYLFRVASVNDVGTGSYSANSSAVTPATTPGSPTAVTGVRGNGQVRLSWTAPVTNGGLPVKDYAIEHSIGGSSWQTFSHVASTATSATVTGLKNGTAYLFRVASVNDVGTGSFTATSSSITPNAVPLPPTNIVATRGRGVVTVSWTTPVSTVGVRITDYRVQQSTNGGISWVTIGDGVSVSTRTVVSGLVMGRGYIFRVAAVGRSGAGDFSSPSAVVTPATVPAAPVGVLATGGLGQIVVSWRAPTSSGGSPISQYIVQYSPSAGRWITSTTAGSNTTTATVSGLLANRSYSFRVLAVNDMGNSPASRVVVARTLRPAVVRV
jgi:hypothetical protein